MLVSVSQPFMVCGPIPNILNTYGPLLINKVLQYHRRAISCPPENSSVALKGDRRLRMRNPVLGNIHKNALCWQQPTGIFW